jgi:diketogulonate reductase-like aldo/keto reductase
MEMRPLGTSGAKISRYGLGTWRVRDRTATTKALLAGIEAGMTHIDTAELYEQQTGSESMIGNMLAGRRMNVFLASKVLPPNASYEGTREACEASLKRLGVPAIDLYYLHWRGRHPLEETFDAMAELVEEGKIRHIGVSNFNVSDLEEAEAILGKGVLAANQILYHLEDRGAESEVIPWCKAHGVTVVAYSPFGAGTFVPNRRRVARMEELGKRLGLNARQLALAFLTRDQGVVAIPKTENVDHAREIAKADVRLPKDIVAELDATFAWKAGLRTI